MATDGLIGMNSSLRQPSSQSGSRRNGDTDSSGIGLDFIKPVMIEGPPPVPPPKALARLHFNDGLLYVIRAEEPARAGSTEKNGWREKALSHPASNLSAKQTHL